MVASLGCSFLLEHVANLVLDEIFKLSQPQVSVFIKLMLDRKFWKSACFVQLNCRVGCGAVHQLRKELMDFAGKFLPLVFCPEKVPDFVLRVEILFILDSHPVVIIGALLFCPRLVHIPLHAGH